jgi:NADPH:quinone reductase-like Zn-dependent oxidoreductase
MRAIRVRNPAGLDNLELVDVPEPGRAGPDEIRVELRASSLNFHDYLVVTGGIPSPGDRIPMSDGAGVVTEVGERVTEFKVGDSVTSHFFPDWIDGTPDQRYLNRYPGDSEDGFACEHVVRHQRYFAHAPKGYSHAEAATLSCAGLTAWRALVVEGRVKPGDSVLIQGSGGVALFAIQFAKMAGATVIVTSSSDEKLGRMKALGADHGINYRTTGDWGSVARKLAGGDGVDHVIELGGAGTLNESMNAVRNGGHVSMIGVLAGNAAEVATGHILVRQIRVIGITVGSHRDMREMVKAIDANGLKPVIDSSFPLESISEAFRHQESGRHFGKIVLEW